MATLDTLTNEQKTSLSASLKGLQGSLKSLKSRFGDGSTIRSQDIQPSQSFELVQPSPSTAGAGLSGTIETLTGTDSFTRDVNREKDIAGANTQRAFEDYLDRLVNSKSRSEIEADVFSERGGVDDLQEELDDINSQILAEQHSRRRKLEALDKNPDGLFGGALDDEKFRIEKDSLRKEADLSVIQMARQGRFDSAKTIADRAVDAQFEREEKITSAVKLNYEVNKELFTTAEQRAFETNLGNRERKLTQEREDAQRLSDAKLDALKTAQMNGAPLGVIQGIQNATSPEAVLQAGGKWASADLLAQEAQRASIAASNTNRLLALGKAGDSNAISQLGFDPREEPEDVKLDATTKRQLNDKVSGSNELISLATEYKELVDKHGFTNTIFGNSEVLGQMDSLRVAMTAAYKEAKSLGALDSGVLTLVEGVIGEEPTSTFNPFRNATGRRSNRIVASLDQLLEATANERDAAITRLGYTPLGSSVQFGLSQDEDSEINSFYGLTSNSTTSSFSPSNYFSN